MGKFNVLLYDKTQVEAIKDAINNKVLVITGGTGTGRSKVSSVLTLLLKSIALNHLLQEALNPDRARIAGINFRLGYRVMQVRNNH